MSRLGWRDDRGSMALELIGVVPIAILVGLAVWQLLLVGYTATTAQEAARTGARAASVEEDGRSAALAALPASMVGSATAGCGGGDLPACQARVTARVPLVLPGFSSPAWSITRTAVLPGEGS